MSTMEAENLERLRSLVDTIVRALVDREDDVRVEVVPEQYHTNIRIEVAPDDFGRVVGKQWYIAKALNRILTSVGRKLRLPVCAVIVVEPDGKRQFCVEQ